MRNEIKRMIVFVVMAGFACVLLLVRGRVLGATVFSFMVWNLFLALIPYGLSFIMLFIYLNKKSKRWEYSLIPLGGLWLLFFPNAPYLFTSYMLLNGVFSAEGGMVLFAFQPWFDLILLSSFIWCGILAGFASLKIVHGIIENYFGIVRGWVAVVVIVFLSSWAIYLGRFVRLNSWDVFTNISALFPYIVLSAERFAFIGLLGVFMLFVYFLMCFFYSD